ncbi:uncharacterized protein N7483_003931 [Penicillium malachiteum]|uniref:uncharacterized protein n=1 Tax=Penicillium malachiteum TaxID=1324776 RepID=UPI002546978C|nr:uncharacterized protein N7483_003931 [Penicillium malachiteum]KAJ5729423.1 hypothetical protein N7483_003931 [Penicillium malachiteum]
MPGEESPALKPQSQEASTPFIPPPPPNPPSSTSQIPVLVTGSGSLGPVINTYGQGCSTRINTVIYADDPRQFYSVDVPEVCAFFKDNIAPKKDDTSLFVSLFDQIQASKERIANEWEFLCKLTGNRNTPSNRVDVPENLEKDGCDIHMKMACPKRPGTEDSKRLTKKPRAAYGSKPEGAPASIVQSSTGALKGAFYVI